MLGEYRGAVVVVAHIDAYNARIGLQWQGAGYVRQGFVSQPGNAVIGRLPRMHLIAKVGGLQGWQLADILGDSSYHVAKRVPAR